MTVVGVTFTRLRTAFTIISRCPILPTEGAESLIVPKPHIVTRLVHHRRNNLDDEADLILTNITSSLDSLQNPSDGTASYTPTIGALSLPPIDRDSSSSDLELFKLHTIVSHQLRRTFRSTVSEIPIGAVRFGLGISSNKGSDSKRDLIALFKNSSADHVESSTSSGHQSMAESWGVAKVLDRKKILCDARDSLPGLLESIRKEVLKKKIFRDSDKIKKDILSELVDTEVNKILMRRLGL